MIFKVHPPLAYVLSALLVGSYQVRSALGQINVQPHTMPKIADVDARYLSFNVEAVEVTGGRFWKPYKDAASGPKPGTQTSQNQSAGIEASLYQYRAPIDLSNPKLRKLAAAYAPSFMRVSGTWRNSTYFQNDDQPAMTSPPDGFKGVMTRAEWKGVINFSHAVHADLVTSVAMSAGTRDKDGVWTPDQAQEFFEFTRSNGGHIAATEFMNEPTFAPAGAAPRGYNAVAFARDVKLFAAFLRKESPDTLLLGPGSIGEGISLVPGTPAGTFPGFIKTDDMMQQTGPLYDAFSYHNYATISQRCAGKAAVTSDVGLTPAWLERNLTVEQFYSNIRDKYLPGKPLWLTETGEAGCGGDPWASTFLDTFRFMDQLGSLAQKGVKTVMVNTLASSDYGLLDEENLQPRPDYWAGLLWKRTMGTRVLDPGNATTSNNVRMYAQCSVHGGGAVTMMLLNLDKSGSATVRLPIAGEKYVLTATDVLSKEVSLNGVLLNAAADGSLPEITPQHFTSGTVQLPAASIAFLVFPKANNSACK